MPSQSDELGQPFNECSSPEYAAEVLVSVIRPIVETMENLDNGRQAAISNAIESAIQMAGHSKRQLRVAMLVRETDWERARIFVSQRGMKSVSSADNIVDVIETLISTFPQHDSI